MDYQVRENAFSYKELYGFSPNLKKSSIGFSFVPSNIKIGN